MAQLGKIYDEAGIEPFVFSEVRVLADVYQRNHAGHRHQNPNKCLI